MSYHTSRPHAQHHPPIVCDAPVPVIFYFFIESHLFSKDVHNFLPSSLCAPFMMDIRNTLGWMEESGEVEEVKLSIFRVQVPYE